MTPTGSRVFIEMILPPIMRQGLIHVPQSTNPSSCEGIVIAAGPKALDINTGDRVIYSRLGTVIDSEHAGNKVEIVDAAAVLCKIE